MNKILIVGHPQSGYADVERLLRACGMAPALSSRREGFAPVQISDTLCKAHSAAPLHLLGPEREVQQIEVAPVWQGLALDLMLGNIDQPLWGWADPKAIHLLDHWRQLDPSLHFILVYDRPHSVVTRTDLQEAATLTREALQQRVDAWTAYNAAVLGFHLRHPERSLLVHSEQVRRSADAYLQQVRTRIDAPWKDRIVGPGGDPRTPADVEDARPGAHAPATAGDFTPLDTSALSTLVAGALLKDQPGSQALYEELQASANLPLEADLAHGEDPALGMEAWLSMVAQQEALQNQRELSRQLQTSRDAVERLAQERERLIEQERQLRLAEKADMAQQLARVQQERASVEAAQASAQQENELLLGQLHEVQEALERHHRQGQDQSKRIDDLQRQILGERELAQQLQARRDAAERLALESERLMEEERRLRLAEQQDATERLASLQQDRARVETQRAHAQQEGEQLLSQLHQVQEELERYFHENRQLRARLQPTAPVPQAIYGAAERIRRQLTYRIGSTLVHHGRSVGGWLRMPWAIRRQIVEYRAEQSRTRDARLPPIHTYADAHEADRLRQHLSYRLGEVYLRHAKTVTGWVRMPWVLMGEVRAYRRARGR